MMAGMIAYFKTIYLNSLYIHATGKPVCESGGVFLVIGLMKAMELPESANTKETQLFNICRQNFLILVEHLSRLKL